MDIKNNKKSIKEEIDSKEKKGISQVWNVWNDLYARVFLDGNTDVVTDMINAALEKEDIRIVEMRTQEQKNDLNGKTVIFDGFAIDDKGRKYVIEIQNKYEAGFESRLAYESAVLIRMTLEKGQKYKDRPESTLIAFCKFKPMGTKKKRLVYNIGRVFLESGERFPDNEKIVMINASHTSDINTLIGKVLHDMKEESAENMLLDSFKKTTHELKDTKEGAKKMGEVQQLIENRGVIKGRAEMVNTMLKNSIPFESVENMLNKEYSPEMVKEILYQAQLLA